MTCVRMMTPRRRERPGTARSGERHRAGRPSALIVHRRHAAVLLRARRGGALVVRGCECRCDVRRAHAVLGPCAIPCASALCIVHCALHSASTGAPPGTASTRAGYSRGAAAHACVWAAPFTSQSVTNRGFAAASARASATGISRSSVPWMTSTGTRACASRRTGLAAVSETPCHRRVYHTAAHTIGPATVPWSALRAGGARRRSGPGRAAARPRTRSPPRPRRTARPAASQSGWPRPSRRRRQTRTGRETAPRPTPPTPAGHLARSPRRWRAPPPLVPCARASGARTR